MRMCFLETMEAMGKNKLTVSRGGLTFKPGSRLSRLFLTRPAPRPLCMLAVWGYGQRPRRRGVSKTAGGGRGAGFKVRPLRLAVRFFARVFHRLKKTHAHRFKYLAGARSLCRSGRAENARRTDLPHELNCVENQCLLCEFSSDSSVYVSNLTKTMLIDSSDWLKLAAYRGDF